MKGKGQFKKIVIAGIGLMGGSLGMAIKHRGIADQVVGLARRPQTLRQAKRAGCIDSGTLDPVQAVQGADLVVLAGPVGSSEGLLRSMLPALAPGCLITDVGSTKTELLRRVMHIMDAYYRRTPRLQQPVFIGSHPMAGSEKTGVEAAQPDLYEDALCIMMPVPTGRKAAHDRLRRLWRSVGCSRIMVAKPREHDALVAAVSHLPHLAAVGLVSQLQGMSARDGRLLETAATGFRDTTRIAAGSSAMWADILMTNHGEVARVLRGYMKKLESVLHLLEKQQRPQLLALLEQASTFRKKMEK